jgi:hypothetical protein
MFPWSKQLPKTLILLQFGSNVGIILFNAHDWKVEWIDQLFPISMHMAFCMQFCSYYKVVLGNFIFWVQWPLNCLYEQCVQWILKPIEWDIKYGGVRMVPW